MHLYNATTTTFSYILVVAFYYLGACIIPVLEIFFFFSDDYMIQQKPASTLCIYHHRYTLLLHAWKKKENGISFFFCLHPKNTWPSTQFSTGFFVCCSCRNCHIVIDCVWCGFNVNVEQNEVWHQHHLRQIRIVKKKKKPVSAHRFTRRSPFGTPKITKRRTQLFFVFSPFLWLPRNVTVWWCIIWFRWRVAKALSCIRISTSRSWRLAGWYIFTGRDRNVMKIVDRFSWPINLLKWSLEKGGRGLGL